MSRRKLAALLISTTVTAGAAFAQRAHGAGSGDLPKCPVMGEPVNLAVSTDTDDGPVYFCCKGCIAKYKADPAKFAAQVEVQRKVLAKRAKVQVTCPVSGEPVDPKVSREIDGRKIFFCCNGCVKKYEAAPAKFAGALAKSYTYQTKCPVMGEDIDPKVFTETASGDRVYFCCKGCDKKLAANPDKYLPKLAAQGFTYPAKAFAAPKDHAHEHGHDHGHGDHGHDHDHDHDH